MSTIYPVAPEEQLIRSSVGKNGDTGNQLHAKVDRVDTNVSGVNTNVTALDTKLGSPLSGSLSQDLVSLKSAVASIQNNTRTTVAMADVMSVPPAGEMYYLIQLNNYDTSGNMEDIDPESQLQVSVKTDAGEERSNQLYVTDESGYIPSTSMARESEGRYSIRYRVTSQTVSEVLLFTFSLIEGGVTRVVDRIARTAAVRETDFNSEDRQNILETKAAVASLKSKSGDGVGYDPFTHSLEALSESINTIGAYFPIEGADGPKHFKLIGSISSTAANAEGFLTLDTPSSFLNIKELIVKANGASSNYEVEILEDAAGTASLCKVIGCKASEHVQLAVDTVFINPDNEAKLYIKVKNLVDDNTTNFDIELRGYVLS